MYRLIIQPRARKQFQKLPKAQQEKIGKVFNFIKADPFSGKKLRGEHKEEYVMRAWPYRIIYTIKKKKVTVYVLAIGHRQSIY